MPGSPDGPARARPARLRERFAFSRAVRSAAWLLALFSGVLCGAVVLVTVVNVTGFLLNVAVRPFGYNVPGLPGYEDAVSFLVGMAVLCMLPYCQLARGHVSVDFFMDWLSERWLACLVRCTDALMGIVAALLAGMLAAGMLSYRADGVRSPVLDWPVWPFMAPGILALGLWAAAAFLLALHPPPPSGDPVRAAEEG